MHGFPHAQRCLFIALFDAVFRRSFPAQLLPKRRLRTCARPQAGQAETEPGVGEYYCNIYMTAALLIWPRKR
jgi:hypothetical protein